MSDFMDIVKNRRSANKFLENIKIPREDFINIFKELSLAPSAFNLQHANYYVVEDEDKKYRIFEAAYKQYKIKTASAVIIVTGNKNAYKDADKIYNGSLMLGIIDKIEYTNMIDMINNLYEDRESFKHDEAIRNASLSAMLFMLIAKNYGWDTCPMIYFDVAEVKSIMEIPEEEVPVLMITIGKMDETSKRIRGFRRPIGEYVKFI